MKLPIFKSPDQTTMLIQNKWASELNPVLSNFLMDGNLLKSISLVNGSNAVSHKLGRKLIGWFLTRQRAAANVHDNQDANQTPNLTLTLVSDANVIVDVFVF